MLPFKTILFATDFSPASSAAFTVAAALARDYHARIIALHAIEPVRMGFSEFGGYVGPNEDHDDAMKRLTALQAPAPGITLEHRLLEGDAASVIVESAAETGADLIVMGTMGRSGLTRLVMGSVAEDVLRRAPCPVLTIRGTIPVQTKEPVEAAEAVVIT